MSELGEMLVIGKPFSKGQATKRFKALLDKTEIITKQLILLSGGKYQELFEVVKNLSLKCEEILKPRGFCRTGWICDDLNCDECGKQNILPQDIPYYYYLSEVDDTKEYEVGSKMSRLGEVRNILNLPVPEGFCLTVRVFEEIMLNEKLRERKNEIFYDVDFENIKEVHTASRFTQEILNSTPPPEHIERIILEAFNNTFGNNSDKKIAVRSSARGEDSSAHSFAGLHRTELNVSRINLLDACVEVLLSKYSPESIVYRYYSGIRDEDMPMSIGCIEMIDSAVSGVMFTEDPQGIKSGIIIQAVRGLGLLVVEGKVNPQEYIVTHSPSPEIISFSYGSQTYLNKVRQTDGIAKVIIDENVTDTPCLTKEQITQLVNYALLIENHYHSPQDIEWTIDKEGKLFILQARPLIFQVSSEKYQDMIIDLNEIELNHKPVLFGGECACNGIGSGNAYIVNNIKELRNVPNNTVLIARKNMPEIASILHKLSALITETGSTTGHLSIIAREIGIPFITNIHNAISSFTQGEPLTVFADECKVYKGIVEELTVLRKIIDVSSEPFRKTRLYTIFHRLGRLIFKLYLTKPNAPDFAPGYCRTLHDVIRFAHETAMREMFSMYENAQRFGSDTYRLNFSVPLDVIIIDLGNGIKSKNSNIITVNDLTSGPFLALIKGMTTPGIMWGGPLTVDVKGFMNVLVSNMTDSSETNRTIGGRSYALVSNEYLNFFSRLGYHFSRLDAFAGEETNSNYINFHFRGGAADPVRRGRRASAIRRILEAYNFGVMQTDDNVIATLRKVPLDTILNLLKELGRLMGAVRNTDVTMLSDSHVDIFVQYFLEGDPAPALRFQ
ncbi:MAG: Phosphoenolpyruvate synthase [Bacteroidota bacterium]|nr:Phosphoenolpyruvate synthase [Bacteroidota bacterium]